MCSINGVGERLQKLSEQIGSKLLVSMATKSSHKLTIYDGENVVDMQVSSFLIESSSNLQVTMIESCTRSDHLLWSYSPLTAETFLIEV